MEYEKISVFFVVCSTVKPHSTNKAIIWEYSKCYEQELRQVGHYTPVASNKM